MVFTRRLSYATPINRVEKQNIATERSRAGQQRSEIALRRRTEIRCPTCGSVAFCVPDRHVNRMWRFPLLARQVLTMRKLAFIVIYFVSLVFQRDIVHLSILIDFLFLGERATIKIGK